MALENILERIATALETLVERSRGGGLVHLAPGESIEFEAADNNNTQSRGKAEGPSNPAGAAQEQASDVKLDKDGLPWDKRIDSSGKTTLADGTWKKARNVDPALVASVQAELRAAMASTTIPQDVQTHGTQPAGPMTLPELQHAAQDVCRELGPRLNEVAGVLQQYGATELSGLAAEHYSNFMESIKALLDTPA